MQPRNYQSGDYTAQATEFQRQHGNMGTPERYAIKAEIERLQRASIGNGDPEERAAISRRLAALDRSL